MASVSQTPPTPGFGKVPRARRILLISVMGVLLAAVLGAYVLFSQLLSGIGSGSRPADEVDDPFGPNPWSRMGDQDLVRTGLRELDNEAELIWKDIDELQKEIDAYQKQFNDLRFSEEGKRLMKDERVVQYFVDKLGQWLPREEEADAAKQNEEPAPTISFESHKRDPEESESSKLLREMNESRQRARKGSRRWDGRP